LSPKHSPFIVLSVTKDKATGLQLCSLDLCCENFSEEDDLFPSSWPSFPSLLGNLTCSLCPSTLGENSFPSLCWDAC
jgi:hypothetical protein